MTRRTHAVLASVVVSLLAACGSSTETAATVARTSENEERYVSSCEGNTKGFWSNKNGQELITQADLAGLMEFTLRDEAGEIFRWSETPQASDLIDLLRGANAADMRNQLTAQWIAFYLNNQHAQFLCEDVEFYFPGFVEGRDSVTFGEFADAVELALMEESTVSRDRMELLKDFFDYVNNDGQACLCWVTGAFSRAR